MSDIAVSEGAAARRSSPLENVKGSPSSGRVFIFAREGFNSCRTFRTARRRAMTQGCLAPSYSKHDTSMEEITS
ncbi:unnamed protein product [Arctia plantaginis]|uniref:Uncharacterized protein n=1 Tax=Arctia plantaginis TaxID=874455 RepID=A0A8S0ZHH2_ARCPL|nr:unnamed protein product [Arctia plantaginis]